MVAQISLHVVNFVTDHCDLRIWISFKEILGIRENNDEKPTVPDALKQLSDNSKEGEWAGDVSWTGEGDEPKDESEETVIPESEISWDDEEQ